MSAITATAEQAREIARRVDGRFGSQSHSAPETSLAEDDGRSAALERLGVILTDHPEQLEHARAFIEPKILFTWRPDLAYVEHDDRLNPVQLDGYLTGDDDVLDEIDDRFREGDAYEDTLNEYLNEVTGADPSELDEGTYEQLREWAQGLDRSEVIKPLVRHCGNALVQLPATDDDTFGSALERASQIEDDEVRYAAIEKVFRDALAGTGIEFDGPNRSAVRELIDETSIDHGFQQAGQWKLRFVVSTDPQDLSMSSFGEHGQKSRELTLEHPSVLLIDPWNGRNHDVRVAGHLTATISPERPARVDSVLGNGSLDKIAGVVHSYYRSPIHVTEIKS